MTTKILGREAVSTFEDELKTRGVSSVHQMFYFNKQINKARQFGRHVCLEVKYQGPQTTH